MTLPRSSTWSPQLLGWSWKGLSFTCAWWSFERTQRKKKHWRKFIPSVCVVFCEATWIGTLKTPFKPHLLPLKIFKGTFGTSKKYSNCIHWNLPSHFVSNIDFPGFIVSILDYQGLSWHGWPLFKTSQDLPLPETKPAKFAPKTGWLEDDPFLLGRPIFRGFCC